MKMTRETGFIYHTSDLGILGVRLRFEGLGLGIFQVVRKRRRYHGSPGHVSPC